MENMRVAVVMAGGAGERFWPLSRKNRPKQLLPLTESGKTLLHEAVERIEPLIPPSQIYVVTGAHIRDAIVADSCGVPPENVLAEPCKRNTAGCLAFAAAHILSKTGLAPENITMAVLTADHRISDGPEFCRCVSAALEGVERMPSIGVIGITPARPDTGYGYIELAEDAAPSFISPGGEGVYPVLRFREKPDAETASEFFESGRFLWNSGMFFWTIASFLDGMKRSSPVHVEAVDAMAEAMHRNDTDRVLEIFEGLPDISIDYALLEKSHNIVMARGDFEWEDIGSWEALNRILPRDNRGNVVSGKSVLCDVRDSIIFQAPGASDITVAALGLDNIAVVVCGDAVLVMNRDRAQDVRKIVDELRRKGCDHI